MSDITLNSLGSGKNNLVITFTDADPIDTVEYVIFIVDSSNSIVATKSFSIEDAQHVTSNNNGSNTIVYEYTGELINGNIYSVQFGKNKDSDLILQPQSVVTTVKVYDIPDAPEPDVDHSGCKITLHWSKVSSNGSVVTSYNIYKAELNESNLFLNGDNELERRDVSGNVLVPCGDVEIDYYVKVGSSYVKNPYGNFKKVDTMDYIKESTAVGSNIFFTDNGLTDMLGNPISNIDGELYDMDGDAILDFSGNMISIEDDTNYVISANGNQVLADANQNAIVYPDGKYSYSESGDTSGQFVPQKYGIYNMIHSVNYVLAHRYGCKIINDEQDEPEPITNLLILDDNDHDYRGVVGRLNKLIDLSGNQVYDLSGNALEPVNDSIKRDLNGQPLLTLLANCPLVGEVYQGLIPNYMSVTTDLAYQHIKHQGDKNIGFLVTAVNAAGESPAMGTIEMPYAVDCDTWNGQVVYTGPDAPTNLESSLSNTDGSGLVLSWVVPASNGQHIGGYLLVVSDMSGNQVYGTIDFEDIPYTLMKSLMKPAGTTVSLTMGFDPNGSNDDGSLGGYFDIAHVIKSTTGLTSMTIKSINISNIKNYSFQLIAVNHNIHKTSQWSSGYGPLFKDVSAFSNATSIVPQSKPMAVTSLTCVPGDKKLTLNWTDSAQTALTQPILGYVITYTVGGQSRIVSATGTSKVISNLVNGTAYTFKIMARNAKGLGPAIDLTVEDVLGGDSNIPVGPPLPPTLYLDGHDSYSVALAWTRPSNSGGSNITGYNVYRSDDGKQTWQLVTTVAGNIYYFNDTEVSSTDLQTYHYKVTAVNVNGESDPSNIVEEHPSTTPGAPNLSILVGKEKITLFMSPDIVGGLINNGGDPLLSYTIYRGVAGSFDFMTGLPVMVTPAIDGSSNPLMPYATNVPLDGSGNAIFVDTDVVNGTMYVYRVMAVNRDGPGASNKPISFSGTYVYTDGLRDYAVPCDVPEVINSLVARSPYNNTAASPSDINLVFRPPVNNGSPITSYQLQYSNDNSTWYTYINGTINGYAPSSVTVTDNTTNLLTTDTSGNFINTGVLSNDNMTIGTEYQVDGSGHVQVVSDASGSVRFKVMVDGSGNNLNGVPSNYVMGQEYFFRVIAENELGMATTYSNVASAKPSRRPSAPTKLSAVTENNSVVLSWKAPLNDGGSPIMYYEIYDTSGSSIEIPPKLLSRQTSLTYTVTGLENGITYDTFAIRAFNKNGPNTPALTFTSVVPYTVTKPPRNLQHVSQDQRLTIRWDAPNNVTEEAVVSYTYTMSTPAGTVVTSATVLANLPRTVTINNLSNGSQYVFSIVANSLNGSSSAVVLDTRINPSFTPSTTAWAVSPLNGSRSGSLVTLTWTTPSNNGGSPITSYLIVYYDTLGNTFYKTLDASESSYQLTSVPQIHAAIFAVNANGVSPMSNVVIF